MWADHETTVDFLGFDHLAQSIVSIVKREDLLPATIGIYGDWGSGKSSLLQIASDVLKQDDDILLLSFNGWLFEGYDDAKTALMENILQSVLAERSLSSKAKTILLNLLKRVDWFRAAGTAIKYGVAGIAGGPAAAGALAIADASSVLKDLPGKVGDIKEEDVETLLESHTTKSMQESIRSFREDFGKLLSETKISSMVVVIDDLDRCLPDTIIETLEAIKLFLFVPRTAFLIGADERLVQYAVRRRFPELPGERSEVGRDYLEKLIQFAVRIPPLGRVETMSYIGLLFAAKAQVPSEKLQSSRTWALDPINVQAGIPFGVAAAKKLLSSLPEGLEQDLILAEHVGPILAVGLNGNPRQCKRFLNTLLMRIHMAKTRNVTLSQQILAKLMLLEYFRPQFFRQLAETQALQDGCPKELAVLEGSIRPEATIQKPKATKDNGATSGKDSSDSDKGEIDKLPASLRVWLDDSWMGEWLPMEPQLANVDLRPYFYFSRDILGSLRGTSRRMSPEAQELIAKLFHESDAARKLALKGFEKLNESDASAIFEELVARAKSSEDMESNRSSLTTLFDLVEVRKDFASQLVVAIEELPETSLPITVVPRLQNACDKTEASSAAKALLQKWAESSTNATLKTASQKRLTAAERRGY